MGGFSLSGVAGFIAGLAVLAGFQLLGTLLTNLTGLPIPGPVVGLVLLFITLITTGYSPSWLSNTCYRLISLLSLFFLPAAVGIFFLGELLQRQYPAILAAILVATPISMALSALIMRALMGRVGPDEP